MCQKSSHKSSLLFRVLNKIELVQLSRPAGHFNFSNYVHVTAALLLYFLNIIIEFPVKLRQRTKGSKAGKQSLFHQYSALLCKNLYRVAHKKWTITFCCPHVYHIHYEKFCNTSTVPKTLIEMSFTMSTHHCNNRSQSFPKLSDCPIHEICQTCLWHI